MKFFIPIYTRIYTYFFLLFSGICTDKRSVKASVVLSGDHLQLQPVVKSQNAISFGYKKSYMQYLMEKKLFEQQSAYMVQLIRNYRSHEAILRPSNSFFYENKLVAAAPQGK